VFQTLHSSLIYQLHPTQYYVEAVRTCSCRHASMSQHLHPTHMSVRRRRQSTVGFRYFFEITEKRIYCTPALMFEVQRVTSPRPWAAPRFWKWGTILRAERANKNFLTPSPTFWPVEGENIA